MSLPRRREGLLTPHNLFSDKMTEYRFTLPDAQPLEDELVLSQSHQQLFQDELLNPKKQAFYCVVNMTRHCIRQEYERRERLEQYTTELVAMSDTQYLGALTLTSLDEDRSRLLYAVEHNKQLADKTERCLTILQKHKMEARNAVAAEQALASTQTRKDVELAGHRANIISQNAKCILESIETSSSASSSVQPAVNTPPCLAEDYAKMNTPVQEWGSRNTIRWIQK